MLFHHDYYIGFVPKNFPVISLQIQNRTVYNYPPKVSEKSIWKTLLKLNSDPIAIISQNFQELGNTYTLSSFLVKKRFVFSRDPELFDFVLRKNQKNYEKTNLANKLQRVSK